jgi:hypothetical protein
MLSDYTKDLHALTGMAVVGVVLLLSLLDRTWNTSDTSNRYEAEYDRKIGAVARQATQWAATAEQDAEPSLAIVHYATSLAYLHAALELADHAKVSEHIHTEVHSFRERLQRRQAQRFRALFESCPNAAPALDAPLGGWVK